MISSIWERPPCPVVLGNIAAYLMHMTGVTHLLTLARGDFLCLCGGRMIDLRIRTCSQYRNRSNLNQEGFALYRGLQISITQLQYIT